VFSVAQNNKFQWLTILLFQKICHLRIPYFSTVTIIGMIGFRI
jgi:hypothetical protein